MRKLIPIFFLALSQSLFAQQTVKVVQGDLIRVTPKLTELQADPNLPNQKDIVRDRYGLISLRGVTKVEPTVINDPTSLPQGEDPALQKTMETNRNASGSETARTEGVDIIQQFDGIGFTNVAPADPTMAVGPNHIVQMINGSSGSYFRIFNKSGTALNAQTYLDLLPSSGFFGQGDPIALYDQLANRFVLCEFGNITGSGNPTHLIMCISQTADPMGAWYVYRFATPGIFPDYPHWSIWNNAYYATTNDFNTAGTAFLGCSMFAFDRTKMLAGDATATVQISTGAYGAPFNTAANRSLAPVSLQGNTPPPANSPGLFAYYSEDALTPAADVDSVGFFTFLPDFTNPANTVIGRLPSMVVAPFKANVCTSRNCAPGCNGSSGYDVLSDRLMHHAYYRRYAGYDAITLQHTVDAGGLRPAARWYELRNTGSGWGVNQQSTFSPDASARFMPSMAMNAAGQFCLGYNITGGNACGSIAFTGRNSADPLNTMTYDENGATCGTGYGTFGNRWGDYNDMNTDPGVGQDSIFWFTSMYGQANWNTRILKLKLTPAAQFDAKTDWVNMNAPGVVSNLICASPGAATSSDFCNNTVTPYVLVRNKGLVPMTSVVIKLNDNGTVTSFPQTGLNIAPNGTQQFILPPYVAALGAHAVKAYVELPNGQPDPIATNDTAYLNYNIINPAVLPLAYNFVNATPFLPAGWSVFNPNNNLAWVRNVAGNGNAGSGFFRNWTPNNSNQVDDIRTIPIATTGLTASDQVVIKFDVAHRYFGASGASWDTLQVLVSTDCGATFLPTTYKKWGPTLATEGISTAEYTTPAIWRTEEIIITGAFLTNPNFVVAFRNISRFGNNTFIDNINIEKRIDRDMLVQSIVRPNLLECATTITPQVVVKNNGISTINSYDVSYVIGATAPVVINITTPIAPNATATHTFPARTGLPFGANTITARTNNPANGSGTGDQAPGNDALARTFQIRPQFNAPFSQGFEGTFLPAEWTLFNPDNNNTWVAANVGKSSSRSIFVDCYNFNLTGQIDDFRSPSINVAGADSLIVTFDLAHKNFVGFNDRLTVHASNDCGVSVLAPAYDKAGAVLATAGSSGANYTNPIDADWRNERVAFGGAALTNGNAIVAFRVTNGYGNNIFIDNINFALRYKRDLLAAAVARPNGVECSGSFAPAFTVTNNGIETINSFTGNYSINGGAPVSANFTGLTLAPNATATFNFPSTSGLPIGTHTIRMYSTNLVTTGGAGDQLLLNDTTTKAFNILGTQTAPLTQDFEGTVMPPANWGINNADNNITWTQTTVGYNSTKSATVQNFNYTAAGSGVRVDELVTPNLTFSNVDSVYLSFDLSALTRQYPGATGLALDSLQVLVSKDCGNTFTTVFNKWGEDLQTVNDPNYPNTASFTPQLTSDWKNVKMNITSATGTSTTGVIVIFRNKSNRDNNIYIDNINLSTLTFPARLKQQGYILYPSPFSGSFTIQHYLPPTDLRSISVVDARGRLVFRKQFGNNGANSSEKVDISKVAAGVYQVKLGYTNKQVVERIVKTK